VWDPKKSRTISAKTHHQNIDFNIFEGMTVTGANTATLSQGRIVYQDGEVRTERGVGRYIDRPPFASYYDALKIKHEREQPVPVQRPQAAE
jgi:dihydropyrimidinase